MKYKDMLMEAKAKGLTSESLMWESVDDLGDILCFVKDMEPQMYWKFIRKQHGRLHKGHYDETFAMHDVNNMKPLGMFWSVAQVEEATRAMSIPSEVNKWDKFVALNSMKNDLNGTVADDVIIKTAVVFWFNDKDYPGNSKIWDYMCMINTRK